MIYVVWASIGQWPVDREERPIGVFSERPTKADVEAMKAQVPARADEDVFLYVFELAAMDRLDLNAEEV